MRWRFQVQKSEGHLVSYCSWSVEGIRVARAVVEIDAAKGEDDGSKGVVCRWVPCAVCRLQLI
jgi:hypothetical protein